MVANLEAKAKEKAEADTRKSKDSKLADNSYMADVWGSETAEGLELDEKKVGRERVLGLLTWPPMVHVCASSHYVGPC